MAPLLAMCTMPGETPSARRRSRHSETAFPDRRSAAREIFGGSKMREGSFELNVAAAGKHTRESIDFDRARFPDGSSPY